MATRTTSKPDNGMGLAQARSKGTKVSPSRSARSIGLADSIATSQDFANFMSSLIGDIVNGRIDIRAANAACNAGGKLLKVVEMEHKYARKEPLRTLALTQPVG